MHETVQHYYGKELTSSADLKTTACCDASAMPAWLKPLLANIHPEVLNRYYGCGLVCPLALESCRVLDLGSGSGRDVYALAQLVGQYGEVVGVDMTEEQLAVAEQYRDYHAKRFGYANVRFLNGYIEHLEALSLSPEYFDVVVSNCVINLSPDKEAVLRGVHHVLKAGGEFYFSDVYADRRLHEAVRRDPVLYGECLGGALYWQDFLHLARRCGFADVRLVESRGLEITDEKLAAKLGDARFCSATYRLFKADDLEDSWEDYGQQVCYRGTLREAEEVFALDVQHRFTRGEAVNVDGNTWRMLKESRFARYFDFSGDFSGHRGAFPAAQVCPVFDRTQAEGCGSSCC